MKIEDNFLDQTAFNELQAFMMGSDCGWHYNDFKVNNKDIDKFQFVQIFYIHASPSSPDLVKLKSIIDIINPIAVIRIKANLLTKTPNIIENEFHIDLNDLSEEKLKQVTTSIFYVNTNNGYTKFEDGTKVESVANRMITFPSNMKHTGTSCTDEKTRIVINFNYFSKH
jgi:hypothetical protein